MPDPGQLPISSDSQNIGARADKCFGARCPENWRPHNVGGTDDFGIDYQVQTIENNQVTDMFLVQLKGTTAPTLNAEKTQFSVQLKTSTVRYYARFTKPILLVLCDLSVATKAIDCRLYYVWIHSELKRVDTRGLSDEQMSVTLYVPASNVLNEETDLTEDLAQFRTLAKIGGSLNVTLENQNPTLDVSSRLSLLEKLPRGFSERSIALIESLAEEPTSPWPARPVDSMPWYLSEIDRHLVAADLEQAEKMLLQAEQQLASAKPIEIGEYWHLTGRLHLLNLDQPAASQAFKRAAEEAPNNVKHLAAWAETEMAVRFCVNGPNDFDDIYPLLTSPAPEVLAVKARLYAVQKKDDDAEKILNSFTGPEQLSTKALFRTMRARWQDAIELCNQGLGLANVKQATRILFVILKAKSQFHLAVDHEDAPSTHVRLPLTGRPSSDLVLLSEAWSGMKDAIEGLRSAGWPANIEVIADVIAATASILHKEEEALNLLRVAAEKRAGMPVLQASVESLAAQTRKFDVALAANQRQPVDSATRLRRAYLLHMMKRDNDCVSFFDLHQASFEVDDPMYAETLTASIISADRMVRTDLVRKWMPLFDATPELAVHRSITNYALDRAKKKPKSEALNALYERFNEHQRPLGIAIQLFYDFNARKADDAEKIIELSLPLSENRFLPLAALIQLSQAHATLDKWDDLLSLMSKERGRFADDQTLIAVESLALDRLGRTPEARNLLSPLISSGTTDEFVLGTYVDIMIRCGFIEEAIQTTEIFAASERDHLKKWDHLRVLHNLVRVNNSSDLRAHDIAWRMGALTDPMDEVNEGIFLMLFMTSPHPKDADPAQAEEYQRRLHNYSTRFPHSKIMRSATFHEDASAEDMMSSIMKIMGDTPETLADKEAKREKRKEQAPIAPFAWRPQYFLSDILDLPHLWELSKAAKGTDAKLLLSMISTPWIARPWSEMSLSVPLLDTVTLLLTYDLGILDTLFQLFPKVAVTQRTFFNLGRLSDPIAGSGQLEKCRAIQQVLQNHFEQLLQPRANHIDLEDKHLEIFQLDNEVKSFAVQAPYLLYSDDEIMRIYCKGYEQELPSVCTLDILAAMEEKGLLTTKEVSRKVSTLCSWGVRVSIQPGWQIGSLPESIVTAKSVTEGADAIRLDQTASAIFNGMWNSTGSGYGEMMQHASRLIMMMLYEHKMSTISVASLMAIWHEKAIAKQDAPPDLTVVPALLFQTAATLAMYSYPNSNRSGQLWHIYFLLLEHLEGEKLSNDLMQNSIELIAAAAANHDLYARKLFFPSLRAFLSAHLVDSRRTKQIFSACYKQWRYALIIDLRVNTTLTSTVAIDSGRDVGWNLWGRNSLAAVLQKISQEDAKPSWRISEGRDSRSKGSYDHPWQSPPVTSIIFRWGGLPMAFRTAYGTIKGGRKRELTISNEADYISVPGDKVTFRISGTHFLAEP